MPVGDVANRILSPFLSEQSYNGIRNIYNKTRYDLLWMRRKTSVFEYKQQKFEFVIVDRNDSIQSRHAAGLFYEAAELQLISQYFRSGTGFVDIGANTGQHGIFVAKALNAKEVIFFEPIPQACRILRENIRLNPSNAYYDTSMVGVALSDRTGFADFRTTKTNLGGSSILIGKAGAIPLMVGDDCLRERQVGFIKIDTEGHEMEVLTGLINTIREQRPMIFVEVDDKNGSSMSEFASQYQYNLTPLTKHYVTCQNFLLIPRLAQKSV